MKKYLLSLYKYKYLKKSEHLSLELFSEQSDLKFNFAEVFSRFAWGKVCLRILIDSGWLGVERICAHAGGDGSLLV